MAGSTLGIKRAGSRCYPNGHDPSLPVPYVAVPSPSSSSSASLLPMAAPVTPNKGKNRADDLSNIHAAIALERDWEPGSDGAETAHHEWVELMTLHLVRRVRGRDCRANSSLVFPD